jgi:hypothetical protein
MDPRSRSSSPRLQTGMGVRDDRHARRERTSRLPVVTPESSHRRRRIAAGRIWVSMRPPCFQSVRRRKPRGRSGGTTCAAELPATHREGRGDDGALPWRKRPAGRGDRRRPPRGTRRTRNQSGRVAPERNCPPGGRYHGRSGEAEPPGRDGARRRATPYANGHPHPPGRDHPDHRAPPWPLRPPTTHPRASPMRPSPPSSRAPTGRTAS